MHYFFFRLSTYTNQEAWYLIKSSVKKNGPIVVGMEMCVLLECLYSGGGGVKTMTPVLLSYMFIYFPGLVCQSF